MLAETAFVELFHQRHGNLVESLLVNEVVQCLDSQSPLGDPISEARRRTLPKFDQILLDHVTQSLLCKTSPPRIGMALINVGDRISVLGNGLSACCPLFSDEHLPLVHWRCLPPWLFCIRLLLHLPCPEQIQEVPATWADLSWWLVQQVRRDNRG
jgi:hypothetical protein